MKCPDCGQYSLTYDFERNGFVCHVYNGFIPAEHIPYWAPTFRLQRAIGYALRKLSEIGAFG